MGELVEESLGTGDPIFDLDFFDWDQFLIDFAVPEQTPSPFLDLPPEPRNRIYHFALGNNQDIRVTARTRPPALLSTCKQIRDEALYIWYISNTFHFTIRNCDVKLVRSFEKLLESFGDGIDGRTEITMKLVGANWENLVQWCLYVWRKELRPLASKPKCGRLWEVISTATIIARNADPEPRSKNRPRAVLRQLEAFRHLAGRLDKRWLD